MQQPSNGHDINNRHHINPAYVFDTLEEAKEHKPAGYIIITQDEQKYFCIEKSEYPEFESLGFKEVSY
ncbi:hypothetical protein [Priestia megaterium]|uniref:hypothetical protein n=1 Tax=Priestia megaterium TaxID=1404 RepID=UPI00366ECD6E